MLTRLSDLSWLVLRSQAQSCRTAGKLHGAIARIQMNTRDPTIGICRDESLEALAQLARSHSDAVVAIHLTDVPFGHIFQKPDDSSSAEIKYFRNNEKWMQREGVYAAIQSTKPQSLAHA